MTKSQAPSWSTRIQERRHERSHRADRTNNSGIKHRRRTESGRDRHRRRLHRRSVSSTTCSTALGTHASFDLDVKAKGDVEIDAHHTVEDTAIVFGQALGQALGDKKGIRRFGDAFIPMDETLAHASVDVSGRPYCVHNR